MLYWISPYLERIWGPFRLLHSYSLLLALGTAAAAVLVWWTLPKVWCRLPHDHGKAICGPDGMKSEGKPTGAGFLVTLLVLPVVLLFAPLAWTDLGAVVCLYAAMLFGYLDDRSDVPWGQLKKGLFDAVVSLLLAFFLYAGHGSQIWWPFVKGVWTVPWELYIPAAALLLWFTMNATNCSDGVDGLAGSLTLISLVCLAAFLYAVVGYAPVARHLLVPSNPLAARWAALLMIAGGGLAGYLWWNAEPSVVLMGDAGSRFLGILVGAGVLVTGNPVLVFVFAPVVLVNGGAGLGKLVLLRLFRRCGLDVRPPSILPPDIAEKQTWIVRHLHGVRFPLHDHCKKALHWSNAQVLMRFVLLQAFLTPLLFVILVKIR